MTDRLECPDCKGSGRQVLGPLTVLCPLCRGLGHLGDGTEPATRTNGQSRDLYPVEIPPVGKQPAVKALLGCPVCLGAGSVISLGGGLRGGKPSTITTWPCPQCGLPRP